LSVTRNWRQKGGFFWSYRNKRFSINETGDHPAVFGFVGLLLICIVSRHVGGIDAIEQTTKRVNEKVIGSAMTDFLYTQIQTAGEMAEWLKAAVC
jgi:hypothetical protein